MDDREETRASESMVPRTWRNLAARRALRSATNEREETRGRVERRNTREGRVQQHARHRGGVLLLDPRLPVARMAYE